MTDAVQDTPEPQDTAMVTRDRVQSAMSADTTTMPTWAQAMRPRNLAEAMRFCQLLANSETVCPAALRGDAAGLLVVIEFGERLGFTVMQALQSICVINGKPGMYGDALLATVRASSRFGDIREEFTGSIKEGTAAYTCTVWRRGSQNPTSHTFSQDDAKRANLWTKKGPWQEYPTRMLQMRARGWTLRDGFADVLQGIQPAEELDDYVIVDAQGRPTTKPQGPVVDAGEANPLNDLLMDITTAADITELRGPVLKAIKASPLKNVPRVMEEYKAREKLLWEQRGVTRDGQPALAAANPQQQGPAQKGCT